VHLAVELELHVPVLAISSLNDAHDLGPIQVIYMKTIHDLPGWGNANSREMHVRKEAIEWVNSERRSATKFTTRSIAEGECIASDERQCSVAVWENLNAIPKLFLTVIGGDHSMVACFARDLR